MMTIERTKTRNLKAEPPSSPMSSKTAILARMAETKISKAELSTDLSSVIISCHSQAKIDNEQTITMTITKASEASLGCWKRLFDENAITHAMPYIMAIMNEVLNQTDRHSPALFGL